jgi:hypothetical protein
MKTNTKKDNKPTEEIKVEETKKKTEEDKAGSVWDSL